MAARPGVKRIDFDTSRRDHDRSVLFAARWQTLSLAKAAESQDPAAGWGRGLVELVSAGIAPGGKGCLMADARPVTSRPQRPAKGGEMSALRRDERRIDDGGGVRFLRTRLSRSWRTMSRA
jgi:hypothetical protein